MNVKIKLFYNFLYLGFLVASTGIALQYFFSPASKEYLLFFLDQSLSILQLNQD